MIIDRPNWVCENTRTECGMPDKATSSGIVTSRSTSSAARPGCSDTTVTWVSDTSGKASTGSTRNAAMPAPMNNSSASITISGWRRQ